CDGSFSKNGSAWLSFYGKELPDTGNCATTYLYEHNDGYKSLYCELSADYLSGLTELSISVAKPTPVPVSTPTPGGTPTGSANDADGDGTPDSEDVCPNDPLKTTEEGC